MCVCVCVLQKQMDALKASILAERQTVTERKARLENEQQTQTQLRREIEVNTASHNTD